MKPRMSGIADDARGVDETGSALSAVHVALEAGLLAGGEIEVVHPELAGLGEERIVDVGDVADALHRVATVDQPALQHVVGDERRRVTEMRRVVRRDPARVHQHVVVGLEGNDRPAGRCRTAAWSARNSFGGGTTTRGSRLIPVSFGRHAGLVAHVELEQDRGERLDRGGVRQLTGVEGPTSRGCRRRWR